VIPLGFEPSLLFVVLYYFLSCVLNNSPFRFLGNYPQTMLYSFRLLFKMLLTFITLLVVYFLTALYFSLVTVNTNFTECKKDAIEIYLLSNGVHTDIVVPLKNDQKDWTKFVSPASTQSGSSFARYVAFGWGDKGFYLNTKTWGDLKFKTAFNALFFLSSTAMHVSYYYQPKESGNL
jgi:hypothetical protein